MRPTYYAVVNDLIGGYAVSEWNKPVSAHDISYQFPIAETATQEDADRIAEALNHVCEVST